MCEFNFKPQVGTTQEQSERLLALGLKKETADMHYWKGVSGTWYLDAKPCGDAEEDSTPAWSLHRLLSIIPKDIEFQVSPMCGRNYALPIELQITCELDICYIKLNGEEFKGFYGTDIYDSAIRCIEWLIKEGYFNKEYLV